MRDLKEPKRSGNQRSGNQRSGPKVSTIPPHRAFADALVAGLLARHGKDQASLARGTILVPNSRAREAIIAAFVRQSENGLLLPRIVPIGDIDAHEAVGVALDGAGGETVPPAIDPLARQLILARLLQDTKASAGDPIMPGEAVRLAQSLATTLDQLTIENIDPQQLRSIGERDGLSDHWQASLRLLTLILEQWPAILAERGLIDLTQRRNRLLDHTADAWRVNPPPGFVIAAGISTAAPAIARLLHTIVRMPTGELVLAGLDQAMPDDEWSAVAGTDDERPIETHPQFHLWLLLDRIGVARGEVDRWRWGSEADARATRSKALSNAMAPARFTGKWETLALSERSLAGVHALELATPGEEAQAIAIAIRHSVETPGQVCALVTPDRDLAVRVSAHLARWGIEAEDSAGQSLSITPAGTLMLAIAGAVASRFAPVELLTLLKHPLVNGGEGRLVWLDGVRALDLALRGPRPGEGLCGISDFLNKGDKRQRPARQAVQPWWAAVSERLAPLETPIATLEDAIAGLRTAIVTLCGDEAWAGPSGRAAAELFDAIERNAADGPRAITWADMPDILRPLTDAIAVRPVTGGHPRVQILGLLEAKLQSMPLMILAGLNEGVWPALAAPDPWLAPQIRKELGLPSLERRIGLSAHDLVGAMGAPSVLITRAKRDATAPTIASRFWLRIEAMTGGLSLPAIDFAQLADAIDRTPGAPQFATRPAPRPAANDRPNRISVTEVDTLKADPFAFYAAKILGLSALNVVDAPPDYAWRGTMIHRALQCWADDHNYAPGALVGVLTATFEAEAIHPLLRALWLPRLAQAALWIEATVAHGWDDGRVPMAAEIRGEIEIDGIKLYGRADRIDRLASGGVAIVDYKTGSVPSKKQTAAGFASQLGLLGLIAEHGGFADKADTAELFEYWSLARDKDTFGKIATPTSTKETGIAAADLVSHTHAGFRAVVAQWLSGDTPFTAKLHPEFAYSDYDHLMRYDEWAGR